MLRGAIDFSDGWRIGGWLHCAGLPVRGRTVLAFVDDVCVGSGTIDQFRQDLADVGLGDGHCGFAFPVTLARHGDRERVAIRLDLSDFALLQQGARIADATPPAATPEGYTDGSIAWMRERHWIDDGEAAFLGDVSSVGAHALVVDDALGTARRLLALYRRAPVRVQESLIRLENLSGERLRLAEGAVLPIVAIHAASGEVVLDQRSDCEQARRYTCGNDRLLFVDARARFAGVSSQTAHVYRAG